MRYFALSCALATLFCGCSTKKKYQTAELAHRALKAALARGDARAIYELLDQKTKWSLMSAFKAQREIRKLVKAHYPIKRQARELRRTHAAGQSRDAKEYYQRLQRQDRLLEQLGAADAPATDQRVGPDRVRFRVGEQKREFCRQDHAWYFCGFRRRFESLKIRANRDLTTVRENAEIFKKGG